MIPFFRSASRAITLTFLTAGFSLHTLAQNITFEYTGTVQTYVVPNGTYSLQIDAWGASGGWNDYNGQRYENCIPGKGGRVQTQLSVQPGQTLYIYVGGKGGDATSGQGGAGGFNGGGNGNTSGTYSGGGGGGASDIRINGTDLSRRIIVAGGGGGAAYNYPDGGDHGGEGGDLKAGDGKSNKGVTDESRGRGATQSEGGTGGQWPSYEKAGDGTMGQGGHGPAGTSGTGGGGGYYGGGGGCWAGGGGGSSYTGNGTSSAKHQQGANEGNGKIIIKSGSGFINDVTTCTDPIVSISRSTTLCEGESISFNAISNYQAQLTWTEGIQNNVAFVPPVGHSIYTVVSSNPRECSFSIEVDVISRTIKATTTNGIVCNGETTTLFGYGAESYTWDHGVQNGVPFVPPAGVNNYTVRANTLNSSQCSSEASVFVVVNYVQARANIVQQTGYAKTWSIDLTPNGGTWPYTYSWTADGNEFSRDEDVSGLAPGKYEVLIVDAIGCATRETYTIAGFVSPNYGGGLKAEMSSDQVYLNVSYNGLFDYKIMNDRGETLITGTVNNAGRIDVSKLPSGNYRICSLTGTTENINFTKW